MSECRPVPANCNMHVNDLNITSSLTIYCLLLLVCVSLSVITGVPAVVLAYKRPIYRVIILSDEYRLSLSAAILPPSWTFG